MPSAYIRWSPDSNGVASVVVAHEAVNFIGRVQFPASPQKMNRKTYNALYRVSHAKEIAAHKAAWYAANKRIAGDRAKKRRVALRIFVSAFKDRPCMDCGVSYPPYVMDLDHRDPTTKLIGPAQLSAKNWSIDRIKVELDKCDVVCSNCHRIRTHHQRIKPGI